MKNLFKLVFAGAIVLAAVACQREQQGVGSEDSGVKEVTTQFVLNVASAPTTKMTASVVQKNGNFRGIDNAKLYVYKTGITGTPFVTDTISACEKEFNLDMLIADDGLDNTGENNKTGGDDETLSSKRVLQLSLPIGSDAVLFYGKAIKASGLKDSDYGVTTAYLSGTPADTKFAAKKILNETNVDAYDATARLMIAVINDILACGVLPDGSLPAITWAQLGHQYEIDKYPESTRYADTQANVTAGVILGRPLVGLEEILGKCYYLFTYIRPSDVSAGRPNGEYRAGSSSAVKTMVIDMYKVITAASETTPTTDSEINAKRLAEVILDRALLYFDGKTGDYFSVQKIKQLLLQYNVVTAEEWAEKYEGALDLNGYPFLDFGVPEGAAQLGFHVYGTSRPDSEGGGTYPRDEFFYYHPNKPLVNPTMTEFEPRKYLYPAELMYYVNSSIRTTDTEVTTDSYPDGVAPWNTETNWTGWTFPGKVTSSTRGVAVVNSINYGVAMLKSSVVYKEGVTQLEDNRYALTNPHEDNKLINVSSAQFQLRGILVGGVNPRMNWQFTRYYTSGETHENLGNLSLFDGVIYDHSLPSNKVPTPDLTPNYTLVYDNYDSSADPIEDQREVYIALEFVNGGEAFWGRDNLIPHGGVFYLVAKLDRPSAEQIGNLTWPTDHQIPPVDAQGASRKIARVFMQDFMTTVVFQINQKSLQKAYYSVPDLRASQMSLGLSVDLQWTPGLEYAVDL